MPDTKVPRKYWWVVAVIVPIAVALIAILPTLLKRPGGSGGGPTITGNNNTISFDYSTRNTFVTNVNVIAREYEQQRGQPLSEELRRQIDAAVAAAQANNHAESIRLFEQIAQAAPVPAVYHNLGVEYERTNNPAASTRAFELSKEKIAEMSGVAAANRTSPAAAVTPPPVSGTGIRTESSAMPAMIVEPMGAPYEAPAEINVVVHGTPLRGMYKVKYQPKPGVTVIMEPGAYDIVLTGKASAGFVLASNVEVKEGTLIRVNPNALVGGVAVQPVTKQGFPGIKTIQFIGQDKLIAQHTETLGVTLPMAPGNYDVIGTTADGQQVKLADGLAVRAQAITTFDPIGEVAAIVVRGTNLQGLDMKAVYALRAGGNTIEAQVQAWDVPMLVRADASYDIALQQAAGLTHIRKGITPKPGELIEIK